MALLRGNGNAKAPRLPNFIDGKDDLDAYLLRFERFAQMRNWHRDDWAVNLSALLTGEALAVYHSDGSRRSNELCQSERSTFEEISAD